MRPLRFPDVERRLLRAGFREVSQKGSHVKYAKDTATGRQIVIVPHHNGDMPQGTLRSIIRRTGLTQKEWEDLD